jgi:hypothetical protein
MAIQLERATRLDLSTGERDEVSRRKTLRLYVLERVVTAHDLGGPLLERAPVRVRWCSSAWASGGPGGVRDGDQSQPSTDRTALPLTPERSEAETPRR